MKGPVSAYSLYNPEAGRRKRLNPLKELFPGLPGGRYAIIYADPPWDYRGKMQYDKSCIKAFNAGFRKSIFLSSAVFNYPTLRLTELKSLDVAAIAEPDSLLFLWTTGPQLANAVELGLAWGFAYATVAFVWDKMKHNPGRYTLSQTELCLVFKRGRIPLPRGARNIRQLVSQARGRHSEKPGAVIEGITAMFPEQKKIELFARRRYPGWDSWGLDLSTPGVQEKPPE